MCLVVLDSAWNSFLPFECRHTLRLALDVVDLLVM